MWGSSFGCCPTSRFPPHLVFADIPRRICARTRKQSPCSQVVQVRSRFDPAFRRGDLGRGEGGAVKTAKKAALGVLAATVMGLVGPTTMAHADAGDTVSGGCGFNTDQNAVATNGQ